LHSAAHIDSNLLTLSENLSANTQTKYVFVYAVMLCAFHRVI